MRKFALPLCLRFLLLAATIGVIPAGCIPPPVNNPPVVNAGADQRVNAGASVTLDGSASSDPDGDPISLSWNQTSGTPISLSSTSEAILTFTAPANGATLRFELTVSDEKSYSVGEVTVSVHPVDQSAQIVEFRQRPITDDPAVNGNLEDNWTLTVLAEMPPQPPGVSPTQGAFALLSAVQFAPLVEVRLSPGARREVELQVGGSSVLLGSVRWIGTTSPLNVSLLLDGSSLATGTSHSFAANRGGSILNARTTGGGRATLSVTNTSGATVTVRIVLG